RFSRDWSSDVCSSDLRAGDRHIARELTGIPTPVVLVVNKLDLVEDKAATLSAFGELGSFAHVAPVSALTGEGTRELVDWIVERRSEERRVGKECVWRW